MNEDLELLVKDLDASQDSIAALLERKAQAVKLEFFEIGYLLNRMKKKLYNFNFSFMGFSSFYDWAEQVLGLKRTTVKNLMLLNQVYCDKSKDGFFRYVGYDRDKHLFTPYIDEKWVGFSQTALVEMLPMSYDDRERISTEMSISAIREFKKQLVGGGQSTDQVKISAGDGQSTDQSDEVVIDNVVSVPDPIVVQAAEVLNCSKRLYLKNKKEREEWLRAYVNNCYLWIELPALGANIYRYDFCNGVYLLVTEFFLAKSPYETLSYQLIGGCLMSHWYYYSCTFNQVIEFLTSYRDEV